jgi:predicted NBD/HSP70 family sugar kinase
VHQNIAELLDAGLIKPGEILKSTGGRPAIGYTIDEGIRCSIGIAVSSSQLRILATDVRQNELAFKNVSLTSSESATIGDQIAEELEIFLSEYSIDRDKVLGVGITFPGVIDQEADVIVLSPTLRIKDISLSSIRRTIPFPVFIENDSSKL